MATDGLPEVSLVVFDEGARIGLVAFARLRRELTHAFGRRVGLVPRDSLRSAVESHVLAESRILYAA
jgi:predicted nucleotidyltransferase